MDRAGVVTLISLSLVLLTVFFYYVNLREVNQQSKLETSPAAVALSNSVSYTDIEGNPVELSDYLGSRIIALAWASWCPDCAGQIQILNELTETNQNVVVLAFNRAESVQTAKSFINFYDLDVNVEFIMDPNDHFFTSIEGYSMPETVIFDETGQIVEHKRGLVTLEQLTLVLTTIK